jgi:universal stress protein A
LKITRILHASDFSPASRPAFRLARDLARALEAELILCHAWQPAALLMGEGYVAPSLLQEMWTTTRQRARRDLDRLAASARRGGHRISILLVEGPPATAIVRAAKRKRAGLVVLGTHGRTGITRMLLGSVAERVVRTALCPVLTVGGRRR